MIRKYEQYDLLMQILIREIPVSLINEFFSTIHSILDIGRRVKKDNEMFVLIEINTNKKKRTYNLNPMSPLKVGIRKK